MDQKNMSEAERNALALKRKNIIIAVLVGLLVIAVAHRFVSKYDGKGKGDLSNANVPAANVNAAPDPTPAPTELEGTYDNATSAMITADSVTATTATNVLIVGNAVGNWFFEASFPIEIRDNANNVIGVGHAEAQTDWMVVTLVPYVANVTLNAPYSGPATVILMKDNPSGEPVNDASVSYNVTL